MIQLHAGLRAPIKDVASQHSLDQRQQALAWWHGIQFCKKVWQNLHRRLILALLVSTASAARLAYVSLVPSFLPFVDSAPMLAATQLAPGAQSTSTSTEVYCHSCNGEVQAEELSSAPMDVCKFELAQARLPQVEDLAEAHGAIQLGRGADALEMHAQRRADRLQA